MLRQRHRFHGRGSLRAVYQRGKTVRAPLVNLKFSQRDPHKPYRVAVIVSRKVSKSAVTRNRIRRRIYEIVRQATPPKPGTDLVFTVFSPTVAEIESEQLRRQIENLLSQASD